MLIVTRKEGESIVVYAPDGTEIEIKCYGNTSARQTRIGVGAPKSWTILRVDARGEIEPGQGE
jgi:sRNA-binding carbon storage regulator CsrA